MNEQTFTVRRQPWKYRSCSEQLETHLIQEH